MNQFRMFRRALAVPLLTCLLAACSHSPDPGKARSGEVSVWSSSFDGTRKLAPQSALALRTGGAVQAGDLVVDPERSDQQVVGYGAAMTDASAELFQQVLHPEERDALFAELFGAGGLGLSLVRVPIGASDFSRSHYSFNDRPAGEVDPELKHFSIEPAKKAQIPALQAAKRANPGLVLMASPWSAPGWMKDNGSLIKGQPKPEHFGALAAYFVRYLDAMQAEGLPVRYVTAQNEPDFEPADYPGMRFTAAARAQFFARHLGPALAARKQPVGILDWDHNWDKPEQPLAVLADPEAARYVTGVAWHCYGGNPKVMAEVRAAYPHKEVFFTECSGGEWAPNWGETLGWMTDNLIIAPSRAGSKGTILWNLALDEKHGPRKGGCGNCRGVVTIDRASRSVTRNVEYYVLGHVSRFVRPGAHRVMSEGGPAGVTHAAFRNPDGSRVLLLHNSGKASVSFAVTSGTKAFTVVAPPGEVMTMVWKVR